MSSFSQIEVRREAAVAWVTMSRPEKLNALTLEMWDELVAAFSDLSADDAIRAVVLTGAGRGFCAGRDQDEASELADDQPLTKERLLEMHRALIPQIVRAAKPIIAAVNGAVAGAGLSLALACDMRIASRDARFTVSFVKRGLTPDAGMSYLLQREVGYSKAFELCITSDLIDADEALRIGLVDRVVDAANLQRTVQAVANDMASLGPRVVQATKALLLDASLAGLDSTLEREAVWQAQIVGDDAYREGIRSFLEERAAKKRGGG
jgi:2-(1,2-epoxy-1,2-dihydrophenyl)acetyl-CoA isomerase